MINILPQRGTPGRRALVDGAVIFLLVCVLVFPLFSVEYLDNWGSIESTFISHARVLREHMPHTSWLPLWYTGTRFDYVYPPLLHYGTALLSLIFGISTAHAYHLYIAILYALGIAGVYWLAFAGSRSRAQAWIAAIFTALFCPAFLMMSDLRHDSPFWVPQRLHVLMSYGEGPHITALSILGIALATSFVALRRWSIPAFMASGVLCAAVVATNFYGATALAIFFSILVWAVFLEVRRPVVWLRAAGIAMIAYGLCAWWLTPSYLKITQLNLRWVATPGKTAHRVIAIGLVAIFCVVSFYLTRGRQNVAWPVFAWGSAIFVAIYVLGRYYLNFSVAGEPMRLAPELDLALILLGTYLLWMAWQRPMLRSGVVVLLCLVCVPRTAKYLRHAWTIFPHAADIRERCEYQTAKWMHDHLPEARTFATGSIRFWYDAWFNNSQVYGGSDQGMLNQIIPLAVWEIVQGEKADLSIPWLQAMGADAIIVSDKTSQEWYHDYPHPEKFKGALESIYDDQKGNVIYRVPRRFAGIARVVERDKILALGPPAADDVAAVTRHVDAVERGPDSPVTVKRTSFEMIDLVASTMQGQAVLIQETYDRAWHAYSEGRALTVERDPSMGFMLIQPPAGTHTVQLRFETPLENRVGLVLTGATVVVIVVLVCVAVRRRSATATAC